MVGLSAKVWARGRTVARPLALAIALTACTPQASGEGEPYVEQSFDQVTTYALAEAEISESSEAQISALQAAKEVGEVSESVLVEAARNTLNCYRDAGLRVEDNGTDIQGGTTVILAYWSPGEGMTQDQGDLLAGACDLHHSAFVNYAYYLQPSARTAYFDEIEKNRAGLVACFEANGVSGTEALSPGELMGANEDLVFDLIDRGSKPVDCLLEAGL